MIPGDLKDFVTVLVGILSVGSTLYTWASHRAKANSNDIKRLDSEIRDVSTRVSKVEGEMEHLPSKESFHQMAIAMVELKGEIGVLSERLKTVSAISDRLQEYMILESSGKAA